MKKLEGCSKDLNTNSQLSELNVTLQAINLKTKRDERYLAERPPCKEIYIGKYMDQCSDYICGVRVSPKTECDGNHR
jgi:rRNA maturation endonuclease Nob1